MGHWDTPANVDAGENGQKYQKSTENKLKYSKGI